MSRRADVVLLKSAKKRATKLAAEDWQPATRSPEAFATARANPRRRCTFCQTVPEHVRVEVDRAHTQSRLGSSVLVDWLREDHGLTLDRNTLETHWRTQRHGTHPA